MALLLIFPTFLVMPSASVSFQSLNRYAGDHLTSLPEASKTPRSQILHLGEQVGSLCSCFLRDAPLDVQEAVLTERNDNSESGTVSPASLSTMTWVPSMETQEALAKVLWTLVVASSACQLDLRTCIVKKMLLNERKYPVELCKGKEGKYTNYSDQTGITRTEGQSLVDQKEDAIAQPQLQTVSDLMRHIRTFAMDRLWSRFHKPRNLLLALMGELGELAELFQWQGDTPTKQMTEGELDKVGQELADVGIYLLRLSDVCCVNIGAITLKIATHQCQPQD